ncbi:hypothetical protein UFOVP728_19 [uncultured Caudovirales phage]|uniref:Uncharacterized protein n=1 Tax=uncultured Caudovirales phage TaxID=2100421 RepID=A0A6J5NPP3_9CAUD|nr:hypothetical protein UFOVP728_19 [uncultured Caudovirales phage]
MTTLRQAAQQALEAWQTATYGHPSHHKATLLAMTALKAALEQQAEPVQPVAWMYTGIKQDGTEHGPHLVWKPEYMDAMSASKGSQATPLYTAPPQRKPLTDEEIEDIWNRYCDELGEASINDAIDIARAVERKARG